MKRMMEVAIANTAATVPAIATIDQVFIYQGSESMSVGNNGRFPCPVLTSTDLVIHERFGRGLGGSSLFLSPPPLSVVLSWH